MEEHAITITVKPKERLLKSLVIYDIPARGMRTVNVKKSQRQSEELLFCAEKAGVPVVKVDVSND